MGEGFGKTLTPCELSWCQCDAHKVLILVCFLFLQVQGSKSLKFLQQIMKYKYFLDALREGQVFTMENTALQQMTTRNVLC
jgi:hypothetical protein